MRRLLILTGLSLLATPVEAANDQAPVGDAREVIVTAQRREADGYDEHVPVVGLRRTADFAVQEVAIVGDTRDAEKRQDEIYAMLRGAIELAAKRGGVELATGDTIVEPLTLANYRGVVLAKDDRPETGKVSFLLKTRLTGGGDAKGAVDRIAAFIKAVQPVGRAEIREVDDLTLSVVKPDQYRAAIADLVTADARATAARMGSEYAVELKGIDRPVEWARASLTDVFLYVPYTYTVVPKR